MNIRDPQFQKILFVSTFLIGFMYVFFFTTHVSFTFKSRSLQLKEHRVRYERLKADVAKAQAAIDKLPELEREVTAIQERWDEVQELLPSSKETATYLLQTKLRATR